MKYPDKLRARKMAKLWWQTEGKDHVESGFCDICGGQTEIPLGEGYPVKGASCISGSGCLMEEAFRAAMRAERRWRSPDLVCWQCVDAYDFKPWEGPFRKPSWWAFWKK